MADEQPAGAPVTDIGAMDAAHPEGVEPAKHQCETPNRLRRTIFVFVSVAISYVSIMALAFKGEGKIAELVADGFVSYIMLVSVSYVAAHSLDRSEIFEKMGRRYRAGE